MTKFETYFVLVTLILVTGGLLTLIIRTYERLRDVRKKQRD